MSKPSRKLTVELDDISSTKLQWAELLLKEIGVPNPKQREIIARAVDFYVEYLEELAVTYSMNPKAKELRNEVYEVMQLTTPRPSVWNSHDLPRVDLESFSVFPKYSMLAKQYINYTPKPFSGKRAKQRHKETKAKNPEGIAYWDKKYNPPTELDVHPSAPIELNGDPESGKLLFNKFESK
jgi:hypothetical protein